MIRFDSEQSQFDSIESHRLSQEWCVMVTPRANWKGFIKFGEVSCPVALYTAASSSERIVFNTLNRETGNRVKREFIDSETGRPVEREAQVKGYEIENGQYIVLEPDEVAAAVPDSDKMLKIDAFIPCAEIDDVYFDKPYYLVPDKMGADAFMLLRDGMKKSKVAAIAHTVLFRRVRTVLIRAHGKGLIGTTLNFDYEVRSSQDAFEDLPDLKIEGEMLELAEHIIGMKTGTFDASAFDDRYEAAVAELVKANFPLTPRGIIKHLGLLKPIYKQTARHGHFGRKPGPDGAFSWEKTDKAAALAKAAGTKARVGVNGSK
jgi:DNA end-binding protein Ku